MHELASRHKFGNMLLNGMMFNLAWLGIVMTHSVVYAPLFAALHLVIHFIVMGKGFPELRVIGVVTVLGCLLDQLLFRVGVFTGAGLSVLPPLWMACLWPVLASTLLHAFSTLRGRYFLSAFLGAIGGAVSYTAGTRLTEVAFGSAVYGPMAVGLLWAMLFPALLDLADVLSRSGRANEKLS
ncbi:MAG: DUF2878 domain-containing protein [Halioglobus sp.]